LSVQLVFKISNLCDHKSPTSQTDRRTDGRHAIPIPRICTKVPCAVKMTQLKCGNWKQLMTKFVDDIILMLITFYYFILNIFYIVRFVRLSLSIIKGYLTWLDLTWCLLKWLLVEAWRRALNTVHTFLLMKSQHKYFTELSNTLRQITH